MVVVVQGSMVALLNGCCRVRLVQQGVLVRSHVLPRAVHTTDDLQWLLATHASVWLFSTADRGCGGREVGSPGCRAECLWCWVCALDASQLP